MFPGEEGTLQREPHCPPPVSVTVGFLSRRSSWKTVCLSVCLLHGISWEAELPSCLGFLGSPDMMQMVQPDNHKLSLLISD